MQRLTLFAMTAMFLLDGAADADFKSNAVTATATATKIDKDGKQTVTITLEIKPGWVIFANPVGNEFFEDDQTQVRFKARQKVAAKVHYPAGKTHSSGKLKVQMYEGRTVIAANIERTPGDDSPLAIAIEYKPFPTDFRTCWIPETIKLTIP